VTQPIRILSFFGMAVQYVLHAQREIIARVLQPLRVGFTERRVRLDVQTELQILPTLVLGGIRLEKVRGDVSRLTGFIKGPGRLGMKALIHLGPTQPRVQLDL
jgi:hypothetical protein